MRGEQVHLVVYATEVVKEIVIITEEEVVHAVHPLRNMLIT